LKVRGKGRGGVERERGGGGGMRDPCLLRHVLKRSHPSIDVCPMLKDLVQLYISCTLQTRDKQGEVSSRQQRGMRRRRKKRKLKSILAIPSTGAQPRLSKRTKGATQQKIKKASTEIQSRLVDSRTETHST
jgi:hypothetical protein